jgi:hypothetical protein
MFAGVAASSMPAVKQFFSQKPFSLSTWGSAIKSKFARFSSKSSFSRFSDNSSRPEKNASYASTPSIKDWRGTNNSRFHESEVQGGFGMDDLEANRELIQAPRASKLLRSSRVQSENWDSRIHLTQEIHIFRGPSE